jgi:hypothetical protein
MRATLDISDDVLDSARELAKARNSTAGRVISDLVRTQFKRVGGMLLTRRNGFLVLPKRGGVITCELVRQLAEDDV